MIQLSRWKVTLVVLATLFGLLFAYPNLLSPAQREALPGWLPKNVLNLGLDLQGGSYLLLEVDVPAMRTARVNNLIEDVRVTLNEAGISTGGFQREEGGVVVTLANPAQQGAAFEALRTLAGAAGPSGQVERTAARVGDNRVRFAYTDAALNGMGSTAVDQSIEVVRRRIDSLGTREPSITRQGADRIGVDHRLRGPVHIAHDRQHDGQGEQRRRQPPGGHGQEIARTPRGHEARGSSAHAQRAAFGALQQHHAGQGDGDQDDGGEQNGLEHGFVHVGATARRSSGGLYHRSLPGANLTRRE